MPAGNLRLYGPALEAIMRAQIDLDGDTFRAVLVTSSYTPDQSAHDTWSDISAAEVANGNGYATHGVPATITVARTGLAARFDVANVSWANATFTAKYAVIVKDANGDGALAAGDLVLAFVDLDTGGGSVSATAATFAVNFPATGDYVLTAAAS